MPELPEVELFKRHLDRTSLGRTISRVRVNDSRILGPSAARLGARLVGARLRSSRRHGKYLLVALGKPGWLVLHFGMNGSLVHFKKAAEEPRYDRLRLDFADGHHLAYVNPRLLGRVELVADAEDFIARERLGLDALDRRLTLAAFARDVGARRRDIKSVLMDQSVVAGIGNIYSDEILFQARLHPRARRPAGQAEPAPAVRQDEKRVAGRGEKRCRFRAHARASAARIPAARAAQRRQVSALRRRHRRDQVRRAHRLLLPALPEGGALIAASSGAPIGDQARPLDMNRRQLAHGRVQGVEYAARPPGSVIVMPEHDAAGAHHPQRLPAVALDRTVRANRRRRSGRSGRYRGFRRIPCCRRTIGQSAPPRGCSSSRRR